ncbi:hypothetical protein [Streptomyces curacoi]|uniref:hypothetical protein n=1 Tax=Streptomyces curacoi TaxID=146536 RepID=UPI000A5E520D|nr:hypothetical protein [Streptomyces curacoi]
MADGPALCREFQRVDVVTEAAGCIGPLDGMDETVQSLVARRVKPSCRSAFHRPSMPPKYPEKMPLLGEGVNRAAAKLGIDPVKPITLLGVAALAEPDLLVEVEATAVIE